MPKQKLFDDESEDEVDIKTENEYAKKYDNWRGKEEIHKLEQKYGTKVLNSDASVSSDSEDESDEPPEVSEEMETQFLKTLALLKKKDPRIYDPGFKFFDEKEKESVKETKTPTLTFADSDDDDDDDDGNIFSIEKKAEINLEQEPVQVKGSTKTEQEGKLKDYLVGKVDHIDSSVQKDLAPLKALWSDPKLNEGEAFLRDYILNKKYLEEGELGESAERLRDDDELGADELTVEQQDKFERAYNFRFEEPDQEYLKRFPRTMNYIRPKDDRRSKKRVEVRTRKDEEKTRKLDDIARLKALKLKEIHEKIAKIKEVTGNEELAFKDEDIEGEFDPEEHDRRMRAIFDEQYYGAADDEKPVFPDLDKELEIENWDNYEPGQEPATPDFSMDGPHCEDEEFNMDADFDPKASRANLIEEMKRSLGSKRRNRKNKSKLAKLLSSDKPKFIPAQDATYAQYMDEYYKMDCEDVIGGDLPTRFKYREVVPNDYGLTVEEILLADDKELTQWVPLKKIVRHKPESAQKSEINAYKQKASDPTLKRKVLPSLFKNLPEEPELVVSKEENSKKKKKKKKNKPKDTNGKDTTVSAELAEDIEPNGDKDREQNGVTDETNEEKVNKKKKKRKDSDVSTNTVTSPNEHNNVAVVKSVETNQSTNVKKAKKNKDSFVSENSNDLTVKDSKTKKFKENVSEKSNILEGKTKNIEGKTKNKKKVKSNSDVAVTNTEVPSTEISKRQKKNRKKRMKAKGMMVENIENATPSKNNINTAKKRKISETDQVSIKKQKNNDFQVKNKSSNKDKEKNKKPLNNEQKIKGAKNKFKNKDKQNKDRFKSKIKQIVDKNSDKEKDPMSNLSDERLKAYGLNPKKYRGFLKYKKF